MDDKIRQFKELVSEISITHYTQKEFTGIVQAIFNEIFGED